MDLIKNTKDLAKIIDLCRKKGVETIEIDGIKLSFSEKALSLKKIKKTSDEEIATQQISDMDLLRWSSAGAEAFN